MPWQHTRGSALLGWVKDDAHHIADQISKRANVRVDAPDDQLRSRGVQRRAHRRAPLTRQ
jgi:hypothetical protein